MPPAPVELQRLRVAIARRLDADLALVGWVQKVSNLILNVNVVIRDVSTREQVFASSVDIRGNTDESWLHASAICSTIACSRNSAAARRRANKEVLQPYQLP